MSHRLAISLSNVGAYYWRQEGYFRSSRYWALNNVSFNLYHSESLGVIGRNGAGKSTLLQLLAGIIKPDRGELVNYGVTASLLSLQLGFIPYLTGRQNAYLSGLLLGLEKSLIAERIDEIKAFSELGDFFEQSINTYSAGMKARLGFSVAFQLDPDILLVDEVLGVGDSEFRTKSADMMRKKIRSDKTIVLVSHNPSMIKQLCDRAIWIEKGVVQAEGPADEVIRAYEASANASK